MTAHVDCLQVIQMPASQRALTRSCAHVAIYETPPSTGRSFLSSSAMLSLCVFALRSRLLPIFTVFSFPVFWPCFLGVFFSGAYSRFGVRKPCLFHPQTGVCYYISCYGSKIVI